MNRHVTVIGDGAWGTAIAALLTRHGHRVTMWSAFPDYAELLDKKRENEKFLPGVPIPRSIRITGEVEGAFCGAELTVCAVPTQFIRHWLRRVRGRYPLKVPVINVAKGIENRTLLRGTQVIREVLGNVPVGALTGPSHAEEVVRSKPTIVVAASRQQRVALSIQQVFSGPLFRVYTNQDLIGAELGGALKNVVAVAAGICDGLGIGDNAKSALLTRGLAEMTRLGVAMGARRHTFAGLAGVGDLITTSISRHGRNRYAGEQIGKGHTLAATLKKMGGKVAEGVWTSKSAVALAKKHGVEMPISQELYRVLFRRKNPRRAMADLMSRAPRPEECAGR